MHGYHSYIQNALLHIDAKSLLLTLSKNLRIQDERRDDYFYIAFLGEHINYELMRRIYEKFQKTRFVLNEQQYSIYYLEFDQNRIVKVDNYENIALADLVIPFDDNTHLSRLYFASGFAVWSGNTILNMTFRDNLQSDIDRILQFKDLSILCGLQDLSHNDDIVVLSEVLLNRTLPRRQLLEMLESPATEIDRAIELVSLIIKFPAYADRLRLLNKIRYNHKNIDGVLSDERTNFVNTIICS